MDSDPPPSSPGSGSGESKERPLSFAAAAVWTLLVLFMCRLFLEMSESARPGAFYDLVSQTGCFILAYSIVLFGILRLHEPEASIRHVLALRPPSVLAMLLALVVGAAMSLPSEWLDQALEALRPRSAIEKEAYDRIFSIDTVGKRITLVLTLVLAQPFFDELFYRGVLFTALRRTRKAESVIMATAAFESLGSMSPRMILSMLAATLVFAWIRGVTGSIFPSIIARSAYYGVVIVPMALGHATPKPTKLLLAGTLAAAILGLLGLSVLSRRDTRLLEGRLADGE